MENAICMKCYRKSEKGTWQLTSESNDARRVYESFGYTLMSKYVHKVKYITKIMDRNNYDGTRTITAYFDNGTKYVYTVKR